METQLLWLLVLASFQDVGGGTPGCRDNQWQCDDGSCISVVWRCDGDGDCLDGSDEMDCHEKVRGRGRCPAGSDQPGCPPVARGNGCLETDFPCANKMCVASETRCNGVDDCQDGSDELDCGRCGDGGLRCPDGACAAVGQRCDGEAQCSDRSDEPASCGRLCAEANGGCSHVCADEPWGALCGCPAGYKLAANGVVCQDVDECALAFPPCSQHCVNTLGSFYCHCRQGFSLDGSTTCLATGNVTRLLTFWKGSVGLLDPESQRFVPVWTPSTDPMTLTFDLAMGLFFWADGTGTIFRTDGKTAEAIYSGQSGLKSLACDWLNGALYWTNQEAESVSMGTADGKSYTAVLRKGIHPTELVLLPPERMMFWIDAGPGDRVTLVRSWMDGSAQRPLAVLTTQTPHSLTADPGARRLYWVSGFKKSVETVRIDGSGRFSFLGVFGGNPGPGPGLGVFEGSYYWADLKGGLWRSSQDQRRSGKRILVQKAGTSLLAVYHELRQPQGSSACVGAPCGLCLLSGSHPDGFTCTCPDAHVLTPDHTCEFPRFVLSSVSSLVLLEFQASRVVQTPLFSWDGILTFDLDWTRDWLYWASKTGQVHRNGLTRVQSQKVATNLPVCVIKLDQRSGALYWVSCDQASIGVTMATGDRPHRLYQASADVKDLYLDWIRGALYWLEGERVLSMSSTGGGGAKELLSLVGAGLSGSIALDLRAGTLLWNTEMAGLSTVSLLPGRRAHAAGAPRWNVSGSVAAAYEPYMLSLSDKVATLWDRRDRRRLRDVAMETPVSGVMVALKDVKPVPKAPVCVHPSVPCPRSSVCLSSAQLCDGTRDCPDGFDEQSCVTSCPRGDFRCRDGGSCISRTLLCDGRAHCHDGSDEAGCSAVTVATAPPASGTANVRCRKGSRACGDGTLCVLLAHVCDGERDCPDGSDEDDCGLPAVPDAPGGLPLVGSSPHPLQTSCPSPSLLCPGSSLCVSKSQICDGTRDCPDGFDEEHCVVSCPRGDFRCRDGESCISRTLLCDGHAHCHDGSDEAGCSAITVATATPASGTANVRCRKGSKACGGGSLCVLLAHVCDGERDCPDGSDEDDCGLPTAPDAPGGLPSAGSSPPLQTSCPSPSLLCPRSSLCVSKSQICDGTRDCPDGFDEERCVASCPQGDFRCRDGRSCVSRTLLCDGRAHCHDSSDEAGCSAVTVVTAPPVSRTGNVRCRKGSRACGDGTQCVLLAHVCDGERDCPDGSDEDVCGLPAVPDPPGGLPLAGSSPPPLQASCPSPSLLCPGSSLCVSKSQICDGTRDCPDGFDEEHCVVSCARGDFRCRDGESCISRTLLCDGRAHCHDGSDEAGCSAVTVATAPPASGTANVRCRKGSRVCGDGTQCVVLAHVCDGERDCPDGSDEDDCGRPAAPDAAGGLPSAGSSPPPPLQTSCPSPSLLCPGSSLCVSKSQICDGKKDCPDGFDEKCVRCDKRDFRCRDGRNCISRTLLCDGRAHCQDSSDEAGCPSRGPVPTSSPSWSGDRSKSVVPKCRKGSRPCAEGTECVLYTHVCDGEKDCSDGSDELDCPTACKEGEFPCAHGKKCVPRAQVCDGRFQCSDASDEADCREKTKSCEHRCDDGRRCLPATFLCDGEADCQDGTDELGCDGSRSSSIDRPPASTTPPSCFARCPGSSLCLAQSQICDGRKDCPDASDEMDCLSRCKNPADFLCGDGRKCIPKSEVCDGRNQCGDGSDEMQCAMADATASPRSSSAPLKCRKGSRRCTDGKECVLYAHVCDGEKDCSDGSDEQGCDTRCKAGEFQCAHGRLCIPLNQVCDGVHQCQDRSDEQDCRAATRGCHHRCDNDTRCLPESFLCDGEKDCFDASDEGNCASQPCSISQFRCASGRCLSEGLRCDGYADCPDGSDEVACGRPPRCPAQLRCPAHHRCLQKEWICDGERDCPDGADEKNCTAPALKCREFQWRCGDSCVPLSWRCDGTKDCLHGDDEGGCGPSRCSAPLYHCGSGECIDPTLVCNGVTNCADRSDEGPGCLHRNCSSPLAPPCGQHCVSTPHGARCYCSLGYTLQSSGISCSDTDECVGAMTGGAACAHTCVNAPGSYACRCHAGFLLEPDDRRCKAKDEPFLLASVQSELLIVGLHRAGVRLLSSASRPVFSLDYHWQEQRVYWLSPDYQSIRWAHIGDPASRGTLVKGLKSDVLAVDWVGSNMYWVDGLAGQIVAVRIGDGLVKPQNYTVVLEEDLEQPSSLVLLPQRGLMLWSELGSAPQIERSAMDGSGRKVVLTRSLGWPVSLSFDLLGDRLYWADEKLRCIGSASLDGEDVKILQLEQTPGPFSVAIFNDKMFWSDTKTRTVRSANKNNGKNQKLLLKRPGQPFGLRLVHPLAQPLAPNPCDQVQCSHICLLAPQSSRFGPLDQDQGLRAVCRCPAGMLLSQDQISCSPIVESAFLLLLSQTSLTQIFLNSLHNSGTLKELPNHRVLALPGVTMASALDADIRTLSLYVADGGPGGSVHLLKLGKSKSNQGLTPAGILLKLQAGDAVTALAVDWVTANFYWSSSKMADLHVTSSDGRYTASLLQGVLTGITSIALHPPSGRVCYTVLGGSGGRTPPQVDCCYMDGRGKAKLWSGTGRPTALVFSEQGDRLYWAHLDGAVISSISLDGSGFRTFSTGGGVLLCFTHVHNMMLWVTLDGETNRLWFSDGLQPRQLWFQTKSSIVEAQAYSKTSQAGSNVCSLRNGNCSQMCLAFPGGRSCGCGRGFYLTNVTSCLALPHCPPGRKSCADGSECVENYKFCNGNSDCKDGSDEQDCPVNFDPLDSASEGGGVGLAAGGSDPSVRLDSRSCDLQRCGGHGRCVGKGGGSGAQGCRCDAGYSGEFCGRAEGGGSRVPIVMGTLCVLTGLVVVGAVVKKRRSWTSVRSPSSEKETLMSSMSRALPDDLYDSDAMELDSPVDSFINVSARTTPTPRPRQP